MWGRSWWINTPASLCLSGTTPKCTSHSLSEVPWGIDWASVDHSGKLVINMFFMALTLFPVSRSHSLAIFPETISQRNYASKSLSQALLLRKLQARDAYATCLLLALKCESTLKITVSTGKCRFLFHRAIRCCYYPVNDSCRGSSM